MRVVSSSQSIEGYQNSQNFWLFGPHFVNQEDPSPPKKKRKRRTKLQVAAKKKDKKAQIAKKTDTKKKEERPNSNQRWTLDRYSRAELKVMEVMSEKVGEDGMGRRIMRRELREGARKHIGDTGLLDHLLKHMVGKVVGSSGERFMRGYTNDGVMEYWLEPAKVEGEWREGEERDVGNAGGCGEEINKLRETIESLNRDMEELRSLKELEINVWKENYEKLQKKNIKLETEMVETKISVQGLEEKYDRLLKRNIKLETKIAVMNGSLQEKEETLREEQKEEQGKAADVEMMEADKSECDNGAGYKKSENKELHLSMPPKNFHSPQLRRTYLQIPCQRRVYVHCLNGSQKSLSHLSQFPPALESNQPPSWTNPQFTV